MGFFSSLFSSGKSEEALNEQQKNDLKNFDILKYDGIRAQRMGKTDYAVKCFTEALKIQKDVETMKYLVSAYFATNKPGQAIEVLDEILATGEEPVNTLLTRAGILGGLGRYTEAVSDCTKAIGIEPDNHLAYFQLAKSERALGRSTDGIDNLSKAIGIKDDFTEGYMLRSEIFLSIGKGNEALADVEKVIGLLPEEDEAAYLLRGRIQEFLGNSDAAFLDYRQALELNPFNEDAYLLAGRLMLAQEKYDEAIALFDEAIEHNEHFAAAYAERGRAKDKTGDSEGALADIKRSLEIKSGGEEKPDTEGRSFDDLYKNVII